MTGNTTPTLALTLGLDRSLAWTGGNSVRHAVAELSAAGTVHTAEAPPLNLALAIDVSGSMAGEKIAAARTTALAVVEALTSRDRLTVVAFDSTADLLLDARPMDEAGRAAARNAIGKLEDRGGTNLWEGWMLSGERVAVAMQADARASHRILLLSDGQANEGVTDAGELARHAAGLAERGVITSAVGIGDGYDELLLGGMAETGGGRLHDAERTAEIAEVVLGELLEGRTALVERTTLRFSVPANVRAEVVGGWSHTVLPGAIEVMVGMLLPDVAKRIVFRLHCPQGEAGTSMLLAASARGWTPDGDAVVEAGPVEVQLRLAAGRDNDAQRRDDTLAGHVLRAWQADVLRRAVAMNRGRDRRAAKHYLQREIRFIERYARGLPGAESLIAELVLVLRRAEEEFDPRMAKELYMASSARSFSKEDYRSAARASLAERLRDGR